MAAAFLVGALIWPVAANAGTAVGGTDRVEAILPPGVAVEDYQNDGYRLKVDGRQAVVEVATAPLGSTAAIAVATGDLPRFGSHNSEVARLARAVTAGSRSEFEAVSRMLGWVSANLSYHLDRAESQEPLAVLRRRTAFCTGFSRLTVALLREIGVEAREVAGLVLVEEGSRPPRFHRWIEVRYSDVGWVFSDPLATHNYVPATYVPLANPKVASTETSGGIVLRRENRILAIDVSPGTHPNVRARKNQPVQHSGALLVRTGGRDGQVRLEGGGLRRTLPLEAGTATFTGVEPGRYHLLLSLADGLDVGGYVDFADRERRRIDFPELSDSPLQIKNARRRRLR